MTKLEQLIKEKCPNGVEWKKIGEITRVFSAARVHKNEWTESGVPFFRSGLFEYVQIFVISNGTNTKYYSNTTRFNAVKESNKSHKKSKTSNSFLLT